VPDHPCRPSYHTLTWADNVPDLERILAATNAAAWVAGREPLDGRMAVRP
jgi:hypothetical protein